VVVCTRAPAFAATDSVYAPVFVVEVVPILTPDVADVELTEAGFGVKVYVAPAGNPLSESATSPVKPFVGISVTVYDAVLPRTIETVDGAALTVKSGGGGGGGCVTTSVALVECDVPPEVPMIVSEYIPAGVEELVATVSVDESAGFGANVAVVPLGRPDAESVTGSAKPAVRFTVTV
jgi:hypothetical protein